MRRDLRAVREDVLHHVLQDERVASVRNPLPRAGQVGSGVGHVAGVTERAVEQLAGRRVIFDDEDFHGNFLLGFV